MNRNPGESAEQWQARAESEYQQALAALEGESSRLGLDGWQFATETYPLLDEEYDRAMDDLDAADDERSNAAIPAKSEDPPTYPG